MSIFEKTKVLCELIAESEDDSPVSATVEVFFDEDMNLNILFEHRDYDNPEYSCFSYAIVANNDCFRIASFGDVSLSGIPSMLRKKFGLELCCCKASEAEAAFYDILEYVKISGARYKLAEELPYKN